MDFFFQVYVFKPELKCPKRKDHPSLALVFLLHFTYVQICFAFFPRNSILPEVDYVAIGARLHCSWKNLHAFVLRFPCFCV